MTLPLDWRTDPIVMIEQQVVPVLLTAPVLLCKLSLGRPVEAEITTWAENALRVCAQLETAFDQRLVPAGFPLSNGDRARCARAGAVLGRFVQDVTRLTPDDEAGLAQALHLFDTAVAPKVEAAVNAARKVFISGVLARQAEHAVAVHTVLSEVQVLSQAIEEVAITAVEDAAPVDAPKVAAITDEISEITQSSRDVIVDAVA